MKSSTGLNLGSNQKVKRDLFCWNIDLNVLTWLDFEFQGMWRPPQDKLDWMVS